MDMSGLCTVWIMWANRAASPVYSTPHRVDANFGAPAIHAVRTALLLLLISRN